MFQGLKGKFEYEETVSTSKVDIKDKFNFEYLIGSLKNIFIFIICVLISSCEMSAGATPFAMAIFAAVGTISVPLIVPFVLIAATTGICFGGVATLKFVISALLYVAIKAFIKTENTRVSNTGIIIFSSILAEIVGLSINGVLLYDALLAVYTSVVTGIFFLIFAEGLPVIYNIVTPKIYSQESIISAGVLLAILVSSFGTISFLGITLRGIISILIVMLMGWKRGAAVGAATGLSISLTLGLMGFGSVATVATYAFCGLLTGILSRYGKVGAIIGFVLGNMILVFYANGSTEVLISIKEIVIASIALFIIPKKMLLVIDDLFDYNRALPGDENVGLIEENTIYKLGAVSDVISDMADNVSSAKNTEASTDEIGSFIKTLNENTCKRCENYAKCWKENYHKMYEQTFNAIEILQIRGEIKEKDIEESVCSQKALLAEGLNLCYEIYKVNKEWQEKVKEQRMQMAMQLKEISHEIDKVKGEIRTSIAVINEDETTERNYHLEFGIARTKKNNSAISGDSNTIIKLKDNKILVAISDGMGSGDAAARNSKKVVLNLEKLLNTGFEEERAIKLINSYLLVGKAPDNFATIDAMIFDPENGLAEFIKIGACPTFISSKGNISRIDSNNLPVGILSEIEIEAKTKMLKKGDTVVMLTDGIIDANPEKKEKVIEEVLSAVKTTSTQRLADIILQEALDSNFGIAKDDMTAIVIRVV